jgi:hypothetical protein
VPLMNASLVVVKFHLNTSRNSLNLVESKKKERVRLRIFTALLIVALFLNAHTSHASSAGIHGCASPIPPPIPGSPVPAPAIPGRLLINEALSTPGSTWNCSEPNKTFSLSGDSWVELYNPQSQPYNLYAAHASFDTGPNTLPYYLPSGAAIAPHGYLVIFPAVYSGTRIIQADLRLIIAGVTIDQVNIPTLTTDQSFARIPDGSNFWRITNTPTIDTSNTSSQVIPAGSSPNQGTGGFGNATPTSAPITGTQTVWSTLQLPTPVATAISASNPTLTAVSTSTTSVNDGWDTPRRILLTTLAVALALMLFWCWRLFNTH